MTNLKKLSILMLIFLLTLTGCNKDEPVNNETNTKIENGQEQDSEQDIGQQDEQEQANEEDEEENAIADYKKIAPVTMNTDIQNESLEDMYQWHIQTPYFEGIEDEETAKLVNDILSNAVLLYEKSNIYIKSPSEEEERNLPYSFSLTPKIMYNKNGILSVGLNISEFTGGAHGLYWSSFYNFDILNSKELELKDLFDENTDCNKLVFDYLFEQVETDEIITERLKSYREKNGDLTFFIQDNKINIYFGIYTLGPYAAGEMVFDIPKEIVEEKLSLIGEVIYSEN